MREKKEGKNMVDGSSNFTGSKVTYLSLGSVKGVTMLSTDSNMTREKFCEENPDETTA